MRSQKIKKSDLNVIRATFQAIASAEGWDREFPNSLPANVMARISDPLGVDVIAYFDEKLRREMKPEV